MAISRRRFLADSAAISVAVAVGACDGDEETPQQSRRIEPTPSCEDGDEPSPEQTEGPFYTPETPRRRNLVEQGVEGEPLLVAGRVLDTRCRPVAGALLDFWQADGNGHYDNEGFRLRGHQFADRRGLFRLRTVVPGAYAGRTRHIHVKVQPRGGDVLTTQLYFPGEAANESDALFDDRLLMDVRGSKARFDFVVA
jgi:protocatechuate 3,4-dioxygenase beta subunit